MITAMGDVMREAYKRNWITTRDGNVALFVKETKEIFLTHPIVTGKHYQVPSLL